MTVAAGLESAERLYPSVEAVPMALWPWRHFTPAEMACKGTGTVRIVPGFMDRLERLRDAWGRPLIVTSCYRDPAYNARVSATGRGGPHTTGRAVDIAIHGFDVLRLSALAAELGFTGIGWRQHGVIAGRFVHLDALDSPARPTAWTYP